MRKIKEKHFQIGSYHIWAKNREEAIKKLQEHLSLNDGRV